MITSLLTNPLFILCFIAILVFIVGLIIASTAHKTFYRRLEKYRDVENSTGVQTFKILQYGIQKNKQKTRIMQYDGKQGDCYDYVQDVILLKEENFFGTNVTSLAIASHEYGHSMQRYQNSIWFPICLLFQKLNSFFSNLAFPLLFIGLIVWLIPFELNIIGKVMIYVALSAFTISLILKLILIPLEFGASRKARKFLKKDIGIKGKELAMIKKIQNAAGMTYVASLFATPYKIVYYLFRR